MSITKKVVVVGRTQGQKELISAIESNTITFALGPAGSGKTYVSVACAVKALRAKEVDRIVLVRPAVESGEHLGYLPGTLLEKMTPYLLPLFDAFRAWITPEDLQHMLEVGVIEVCPLAYLRGRSLNKAFCLFDEFQNTNPSQMLMALTRLGVGSKAVIGGDLTQIDLPGYGLSRSGLYQAQQTLDHNLPDIKFVNLTQSDIVRSKVVKTVIEAYERKSLLEESNLSLVPTICLTPNSEALVSVNGNGNGKH